MAFQALVRYRRRRTETTPGRRSEPRGNGNDYRWVYVNTNVPVGGREHVKVFADQDAANEWLKANDPEGVAFEYPVIAKEAANLSGLLQNQRVDAGQDQSDKHRNSDCSKVVEARRHLRPSRRPPGPQR